jgi:hypothetical protein
VRQRNNRNRVGGFQLKFPVIIEKSLLELPEAKRTKENKTKGEEEIFH